MGRLSGLAVFLGVIIVVSFCGSDPTGKNGKKDDPYQKDTLPEIEVNPTALKFSPLPPGQTQTLIVSIQNVGGGDDLKLKNIYIRDEGTPFTVELPEPMFVLNGEKAEVPVTYKAPTLPPQSTVLMIQTNAATSPLVQIPISVLAQSTDLTIFPDPIAFGEVLGGETSVITVTITNSGSRTTSITNTYIQAGSSKDFAVDPPDFPVVLEPGKQLMVDTSYTPTEGGADEGTFIVAFAEEGIQTLTTIRMTGTEVGPEINVAPPKVDMGYIALGAKGVQELAVFNMGQHDLKISKLYIAPMSNKDLAVDDAPTSTLTVKPGSKVIFHISFAPTQFFAPTSDPIGGVVIESNDHDESLVNVPVYGNIDAAFIKVDPPTVDFGIVAQGWTIERSLLVQNVGHATLNISDIEIIANTDKNEFEIVDFGKLTGGQGSLAQDESTTIVLAFTNSGAQSGTTAGKLAIQSSDPMTPEVQVPMIAQRGGVPECKVSFTPPKMEFGTVAHGAETVKTMYVKNSGSGYCSWKSGIIRECTSFMGLMTTCSETGPKSQLFIPLTLPIPMMNGMAPGTAQPVDIRYVPPKTVPWIPMFEEYYATFQVTYQEEYSKPNEWTVHTYPLAQNGTLQWNLHGSSGVADIAVLPGELDFGLVTIGCYSQTMTLRIYNAGTAPLQITNIYLEGCGPEFDDKNLPELPTEVQPSQYKEASVVYLPQNEGPDSCFLVIESSDLDSPKVKVPLHGEGTFETENIDYFEQITGKKVDVLFAIDGSGSMCGELDNVAKNFTSLTSVAAQWENDYQLGIIHLDLGDEDTVSKLMGSPRILDKTNSSQFASNVKAIGCNKSSGSQEAGLEAGRRALMPPYTNDTATPCTCGDGKACPPACQEPDICMEGKCGGPNRGFLRKDAALEVVFVSDEEDQSPGSVPFYIDYYKSIKGFMNEDLFHAHAIVGDWNKGCKVSNDDGADAGNRYIEVQKATGGVFGSICDASFSNVLKDIGNKAFGVQVQFFLSAQADSTPGNIKVWVDSGSGYKECSTGWQYHPASNSIVFDKAGNCMPAPGNNIKVWYKMVCNTE